MKNTTIITFILLCLSSIGSGQSTFFTRFDLADTSILVSNLVQDDSDNFYVLTSSNEYVPVGIPIEGPLNFGSNVFKIGTSGTLQDSWFYQTAVANGAFFLPGSNPAAHMGFMNQELSIPYTKNYGIIDCSQPVGSGIRTSRIARLKANGQTGQLVEDEVFNEMGDCESPRIISYQIIGNKEYLLSYNEHMQQFQILKSEEGEAMTLSGQFELSGTELRASSIRSIFKNNEFVIAANTLADNRIILLQVDLQGNTTWTKTLEETEDFTVYQLLPDLDAQGFVLGTYFLPDTSIRINSRLFFLDGQGELLHQRSYNLLFTDLNSEYGQGYLATWKRRTALTDSLGGLTVALLDASGSFQSLNNYGDKYDAPAKILPIDNQRFALAGHNIEYQNGNLLNPFSGFLLVDEIDALTVSTASTPIAETVKIQLAPNPFSNKLTIAIQQQEVIKEFIIVDSYGRILKIINDIDQQVELDLGELPQGAYYLLVKDRMGRAIHTEKLIKL